MKPVYFADDQRLFFGGLENQAGPGTFDDHFPVGQHSFDIFFGKGSAPVQGILDGRLAVGPADGHLDHHVGGLDGHPGAVSRGPVAGMPAIGDIAAQGAFHGHGDDPGILTGGG